MIQVLKENAFKNIDIKKYLCYFESTVRHRKYEPMDVAGNLDFRT